MPQIKIDHVVSFSSEDPNHVANNLLSSDTTKKWKCRTPGEKMASVVLQLEKACVITGIDIGNEHSAYVEVLVSRSGTTDDFKVLLVMSSFMTPLESRQSQNVNKVRMFKQEDLSKPECEEKWDRVKIVCTQPCNRHVQYGLSFINFYTSDHLPSQPLQSSIGKFTLRPESPDNLSAGSLFARRKETQQEPLKAAAAIREASSSLTSSSASPKPKINKPTLTPRLQNDSDDSATSSPRPRNRNEILYAKDEEESSEKIDKIIEKKAKEKQERKDKEEKEAIKTPKDKKDKREREPKKHRNTKQPLDISVTSPGNSKMKRTDESRTKKPSLDTSLTSPGPSSVNKTEKETNKRKHSDESFSRAKKVKDKITKPFARLLEGVVLVISGIQNPDRANLRASALAMGARYKPDWDKDCTHLVCAFANTPKFNQVRGKGRIVTRKWIEDCYNKRKRLPWRRYALDKKDVGDESEEEIWEEVVKDITPPRILTEDSDAHCEKEEGSDTEERVAQILSKQAQKPASNKKDIYEADTDTETNEEALTAQDVNGFKNKLSTFFENKIFFLDDTFEEEIYNQIKRYITAYGGLLNDDPTKDVDIFVTNKNVILKEINPDATCVLPDWVWECHNCQKLVPMDEYVI